MKRNWYAAIILLALCVLLFRAGQYVDRTTAGMQRQLEAAYALAEQGDYDTALSIYSELAASAAPADREADEKRVAELKRLKQASQAGRQPQNDETVTPEPKNDPDPKMISLIDALARRCDARARS